MSVIASDYLNKCHFGDVRDVLKSMIADDVKVQTIVTSPPYWGLRSYLPADHPDKAREIGSEPTLGEFLQTMVGVFDLCREVLADDGTMFVNMGDSYTSGGRSTWRSGASENKGHEVQNGQARPDTPQGLKPKDLMGQPWRLAFALQDAGWYLRQDIIWAKPNPMPESTKDRCTKAHEYIFLLSKQERYYFDSGAISEECAQDEMANGFRGGAYCNNATIDNVEGGKRTTRGNYKSPDGWNTGPGAHGSFHPEGREKGRSARDSFKRDGSKREQAIPGQSVGTHRPDREESEWDTTRRNKRSVWTVATEPYKEAHFATFPSKLIEPCVLAGAPAGGIVLDIFMGSGTTAKVSERLGRKWIGIDIDERNGALQLDRLRQPSLDLEAT